MNKHIVSVGDLVLDVILSAALPAEPGKHQNAAARRVEPGGAGNFMIAARRMGLDVSAAGVVGADEFGAQITAALRGEGIDTRCVVAVPGSTSTLVIVLIDPASGEHVFIGHYGEGPEAPYPPGLDQRIDSADALFLQGYTLAEARVVSMALRAVDRAAAAGRPVYADVGPFMALVPPDRIAWLLDRADVLLMTEDEVPLIGGGRTGAAAYGYLLDHRPALLVVKQGASGCTVITRSGAEQVPGFPAQVVDTVGAGDCFDAAFVAGALHGLAPAQCGRLANAMGALTASRMGAGRNAPACTEVMALLRDDRIKYPC